MPQPIYKIPLRDIPEANLRAIPGLINRIIIGPTQYPLALQEAFVQLLTEAGVSDPESKICVSDIPIKTMMTLSWSGCFEKRVIPERLGFDLLPDDHVAVSNNLMVSFGSAVENCSLY